tara:strand:- start:927 stop:1040 length:114 start_codon:yes stop_codon:yes gene_type:complete
MKKETEKVIYINLRENENFKKWRVNLNKIKNFRKDDK